MAKKINSSVWTWFHLCLVMFKISETINVKFSLKKSESFLAGLFQDKSLIVLNLAAHGLLFLFSVCKTLTNKHQLFKVVLWLKVSWLHTFSFFALFWFQALTINISHAYLPFQVLDWYRTTGHAQLQRSELGDSFESARQIQADHQQFEHQARVCRIKIKCLFILGFSSVKI